MGALGSALGDRLLRSWTSLPSTEAAWDFGLQIWQATMGSFLADFRLPPNQADSVDISSFFTPRRPAVAAESKKKQ